MTVNIHYKLYSLLTRGERPFVNEGHSHQFTDEIRRRDGKEQGVYRKEIRKAC